MRGETIVCIAPRSWNSLWRETQQIMSRLAAQNRVLYFEPPRDSGEPVGAALYRNLPNLLRLHVQQINDNLTVIATPPSLPYARRHLPAGLLRLSTPLVARTNAAVLRRHIRRALRAFDVRDPILWLSEPRHISILGTLGEQLVCYYNYDEYHEFVFNARMKALLLDYDNRLTRRADIVFATSRAQCERRRALNPASYCIPNGVDFALFNRTLAPNLPLPPDIAALPRPIIGFAGWLAQTIDVALLRRVAEAYPACSLVLIGQDNLADTDDLRRLRALPNVFFLGHKDHRQLPNYLQAFDVALMPYALVGHVYSAYPLKLHEYLAAGRSSVATALPELRAFSHVVRIADSHAAFIAQIAEALHDHGAAAVAARVAVAQENTWDQRVVEIYRILQSHAGRRGGAAALERPS